jgi:hypothetical protein
MRKEVATKALTYNEGKPLQPFRMSTAKMMNRGRFRNFLSNLGFPNISNAQADALFAAYDRDKMGMVSVDAVRQDVVPASSRTTFITWQEEAHPPVPVIPTLPGFEPPVTARTSHLAPPLSRNVDPDKLAPVIIQDDRNVDEVRIVCKLAWARGSWRGVSMVRGIQSQSATWVSTCPRR